MSTGHGVLRRGVRIGRDTVISHNTTIEREVVIGDNVRISALTHLTVACLLEDDVEIGARVVTINDNELRWRRVDQVLKPPIFRTFPLERAGDAHALMEANTHVGKIVLLV